MPYVSKYKNFSVASFYQTIDGSYVREKEIIEVEGRNVYSFEAYSKQVKFKQLNKIICDEISNVDVLKMIYASGLSGCGGSYIPLVKKWEAAKPYKPEYLVVNGLEGEPFTFKDYYIMKNHPHILLEGIAIACRILDIKEVYLVINSAYKICYKNIKMIIDKGSPTLKGINIHLVYGPNPDLYIVGEETALLNYLQGERAETRLKPPFPHQKGLWGKSTVINNVETLSWIPVILNTPERFNPHHPKLVTLLGDVEYPGIYEVNIGDSLLDIINKAKSKDLSFVEVGGISGGLIPVSLIDVVYDSSGLGELGVQPGSGTIRLFNATHDPLKEMSKSIDFFKDESCGRCTPCRVGTQELSKFARQLIAGYATQESINWLRGVAETMQVTSSCGLGKAAPVPVLTYLKYFWNQ